MLKLAQTAKAKLANGDKKGALCAMKKRKLYEGELNKIENVKMTLETQAINLEGAAHNVHTFNAMRSGNSAISSIRKAMGIERVDEMLDDIKEEMEFHREVDNAFAQPIDPLLADDDDLLAELDELAGIEKTKTSSSMWSSSATYNRPEAAVAQSPKKQASRIALFG
jgi:charged multivesicular body protein 4